MEDEISLSEKLCHIEYIAYTIEKYYEDCYPDINYHDMIAKLLTSDEIDFLYAVLDNLVCNRVYKLMTGHCSLQAMLNNPIEKLENQADDAMNELLAIKAKYQII